MGDEKKVVYSCDGRSYEYVSRILALSYAFDSPEASKAIRANIIYFKNKVSLQGIILAKQYIYDDFISDVELPDSAYVGLAFTVFSVIYESKDLLQNKLVKVYCAYDKEQEKLPGSFVHSISIGDLVDFVGFIDSDIEFDNLNLSSFSGISPIYAEWEEIGVVQKNFASKIGINLNV